MSDTVWITLRGVQLRVEPLEGDERLPHGMTLVGTYLEQVHGPKLIARIELDAGAVIDLQLLIGRAAEDTGHTVLAAVRFGEPGLVMHLYAIEHDPAGDVEHGYLLGIVQRFAAEFVQGGTDLRIEAAALFGAVFGDGAVVEPIEKAIGHLGL